MTEPFDAKIFTRDNLPIGRYPEPIVVKLVQAAYERGLNDGLEEARQKAAGVIFKFNSEPIGISHGAKKVATPKCKAKDREGWISGKPQIATEKELKTRWSGAAPGEKFLCGFCGYKFKVGDYYRWIFTNGSKVKGAGGNPFACKGCDTGDAHEMAVKFASRRELYESLDNIF